MEKPSNPASQSPILITGGGQRLGLAAALALHSETTPVIVTYRNNTRHLDQLQRLGIQTIHADLSTTGAVLALVQTIKQQYNSLRAIIHNASEWLSEAKEQSESPEMIFDRMMHIHAKVPYLINRQLSPLLKQFAEYSGDCSADIIHMTDFIIEKGSKKHIAYAASKAALHNLTLSFAAQLAPNIKVNSIAPALLMFNEHDDEAYKQHALQKSLMKLAPGEQEGVKAIRYLLDSDYITGRSLSIDGGRHLA
ncbi:dihydromonapterin reductase [Alkalimarinus sediminis]|uniref:Dihydromonapterin reductase n=1 Tax=Alkalimarinus sediminis TaxID=1632866 RepID=A0A9E8KQV1_9ALTE|nr:dihydromonapterin reductase [Alkalimarinus sediminis]UZW75247.1 dihydromonapterin reductase [Alkalimarinus sediminis]